MILLLSSVQVVPQVTQAQGGEPWEELLLWDGMYFPSLEAEKNSCVVSSQIKKSLRIISSS